MNKKQTFYVFDEHTDYVSACIKKGFHLIKNDYPDIKLELNQEIFTVLGINECYSGWVANVVPVRNFCFSELYSIALSSNIYDDKVVSLGLILRYFYADFICKIKNELLNRKLDRHEKMIFKIIINDIRTKSYDVSKMNELYTYSCLLLNK